MRRPYVAVTAGVFIQVLLVILLGGIEILYLLKFNSKGRAGFGLFPFVYLLNLGKLLVKVLLKAPETASCKINSLHNIFPLAVLYIICHHNTYE